MTGRLCTACPPSVGAAASDAPMGRGCPFTTTALLLLGGSALRVEESAAGKVKRRDAREEEAEREGSE